MKNNTSIRVPLKAQAKIKELWRDSDGYWATLNPGFFSPSTGTHSIHEDTQKRMLFEISQIEEERFDVRNECGGVISTVSVDEAIELFPKLKPGRSIVSHATGCRIEQIVKGLQHNPLVYERAVQEGGSVCYFIGNATIRVMEIESDGKLHLTPLGGDETVHGEWVDLNEATVSDYARRLEAQINAERANGKQFQPLIRFSGDRNLPLMKALLDILTTSPELLRGLVEIIPSDGYPLCVTETQHKRPPYLRAVDDISQLLQNHGYEDASKFLDCSYEL